MVELHSIESLTASLTSPLIRKYTFQVFELQQMYSVSDMCKIVEYMVDRPCWFVNDVLAHPTPTHYRFYQ